MKPHRRRNTPPRRSEENASAHPVEPVPPAAEEVQPEQTHPNVVPPAPAPEAAAEDVVYDYTQGGEQPQVYQQADGTYQQQPNVVPPAADPYAQQPVPPAADPYAQQQPQPPEQQPTYQQAAPAPAPATPQLNRPKGAPATGRRGAIKRPAGGARPAPGARKRPVPPTQTGGGFSFMSVLMMIIAAILFILAILVILPSDLSKIKGYASNSDSLEKKEPVNLLDKTQQAMMNNKSITFTEEQVNQYVAARVKGKQSGAMGGMMKFKGIGIDFRNGIAEVFLERSFLGIPVTSSSRFKLHVFGSQSQWRSDGGRVGKLNLGGESQFGPILAAFARLSAACEAEVELIDSASTVTFENDKVTLDFR